MHFLAKTLPVLALAGSALAQTFSDCNPMERDDCKPNKALGVSNYTIDFTKSIMTDKVWNVTTGKIDYNDDGALFRIGTKGEQPLVRTNFYFFFGTAEIIMKASHGQGIVSSIVLQSDDLDEVDWEWIGGNATHVQTNYFGKGNTTSYDRAIWHEVTNPDTQETFHNYTIDWSKEKIDFYIDSNMIRTLKYEEANGGKNFPQTPCDLRLGIWPGGDSESEGTVEWSGGKVNYDEAPFDMVVKSVRVKDASNATEYVWGDRSGSWESIQLKTEAKPIKLDGENSQSTAQSATQRWNNLSQGAKVAIIASVCGVLGIGLAVFAFCCIRQRRAGKHERLVEDAKFEKNQAELMAYRAEMGRLRTEKFAQVSTMPVHAGSIGNMGASIHPPRTPVHGGASPLLGGGRPGYQRY